MAFSDSFLQELKYRADMASVAQRYVNLRKSGRGYVGLCPFHNEKTPSFHVFEDTQSFYCFGCGAGGDVITFIRQIENLDYVDAVRMLASQVGLDIPDEAENGAAAKIRRRILEMNREAAKFFYSCLKSPEGEAGRKYLKKRRLEVSTIKSFGLGYAPAKWDELKNYLRSLGFSDEEMIAASLTVSKNGHSYDKFRGRIIFPIIDLQGNVIAFGGRVLDDSKPKYLNSSDTPVFKKSYGLYALNFAKGSADGTLILCEGYMDVIALHQAGFKNAVATLGTALTAEQARLMARYAKDVIVSYDSDEAGQKAAQRAIGLLTAVGINVRVLRIEGGKDPDEFIKAYGADKFGIILKKSGNHIEYRIERAKSKYNLNIPDQKIEFLKDAKEVLASVESRVEREVYAGKLAQEMDITKDAFLAEIDRLAARKKSKYGKTQLRNEISAATGLRDRINPEKGKYLKAANAEETLIVLLFKNPDFQKIVDEIIKPEDFLTEFNRRFYTAQRNLILSGMQPDLSVLGEQFSPAETGRIMKMLVLRQVSNTIEEARDCANVILQEKLLKHDDGVDDLEKINEIKNKKLEQKKHRREQ